MSRMCFRIWASSRARRRTTPRRKRITFGPWLHGKKAWVRSMRTSRPISSTSRTSTARRATIRSRSRPTFGRLAMFERTVGPSAPFLLLSLVNVARTYAVLGDLANAVKYQTRLEQATETAIALNLSIGSDRQRVAYLTPIAERTERTLSLNLQMTPGDPDSTALAVTVLLQRKGRVLDAAADMQAALRRHADPDSQALLDQLNDVVGQLARLVLNGPQKTPVEEYRKVDCRARRTEGTARIADRTSKRGVSGGLRAGDARGGAGGDTRQRRAHRVCGVPPVRSGDRQRRRGVRETPLCRLRRPPHRPAERRRSRRRGDDRQGGRGAAWSLGRSGAQRRAAPVAGARGCRHAPATRPRRRQHPPADLAGWRAQPHSVRGAAGRARPLSGPALSLHVSDERARPAADAGAARGSARAAHRGESGIRRLVRR